MPPPYFPPNVPFSYDAYFEAMQRKKRRRRLGSDETKILVDAFETNPKPNASTRDSLAKKLKMTPRAIQIWFQNRRAKMKRDHSDVSSGLTFGTPTTSPATSTSSHLSPQDQPQQSISSIESRHNISPLEIEENSHESSVNLLFGQEEYQEMHDLAPLSRFLLEPQTSTSFESVRAGTGDNDTQNNLPFYRNSRYSDQINLDIFFDSRPVPLLNGDLDAKQQHGQSASPFLRNAFSDFMMSTMPLNKQSLEDLVANGPCTEL